MEIQLATRRATFDDVPFLLDLRRQAMNPHLEKSDVSLSDGAHRKRIDLAFDSARVIQIDGKDAGLLKCIRGAHEW